MGNITAFYSDVVGGVIIQTSDEHNLVTLQGVKESDLAVIQERVNHSNYMLELHNLKNVADSLKENLAKNISSLIEEELSYDSGIDEVNKLAQNVVTSGDSEQLPENVRVAFVKAVADDVTSKPNISADDIKNHNKLLSFIRGSLFSSSVKEGDYTLKISGGTSNGAYVYQAYVDTPTEKNVGPITLSSNNAQNRNALANYLEAVKEFGFDTANDAIKTVISELTGMGKNKVSAIYDLGKVIVDVATGKEAEVSKIGVALKTFGKEALLGVVDYFINRIGARKYQQAEGMDKLNFLNWEKQYKDKFRDALDIIYEADITYNNILSAIKYDNSDLDGLKTSIEKAESFINKLAALP